MLLLVMLCRRPAPCICLLENLRRACTTRPSPAEEREEGREEEERRSKWVRETGRSLTQAILTFSTIAKKVLKGSGGDGRAAVPHQRAFCPLPRGSALLQYLQWHRPAAGSPARLCQQENPSATSSRHCQPVQSSLSLGERAPAFARPLRITGGRVIPSPPVLAQQTIPTATPVTIPAEANKLSQRDKAESFTLCEFKPKFCFFFPTPLQQTDSSE